MPARVRHARRLLPIGLVLGLTPSCDPGATPPPIAILADTTGMDPLLVRRIEDAVLAAETLPHDPAARMELAMVYDANGLWEPARLSYEGCVALAPDDQRAWYHLARVRVELAEPDGALRAFDRSIAVDGRYAPAHWRRGDLLYRLGQLDEAQSAYLRATELAPDEAAGWLGLARVYLERDQPRRAIARLNALLEKNSDAPFAHGLLARAWRRLGEDRRAERALRREAHAGTAGVVDPWTAVVRARATGLVVTLKTAGARLAAGDAAGALTILEPLRAEHGRNLAVVDLIVRALLLDGRHARALEILDDAELPEHYLLELSTGRALAGSGQARRASSHLERAVALNPSLAEAHTALGEARLQLGLLGEAEASFAAALEHGARALRDRLLLGRVQLARDRDEEALATFDEATRAFPNSATAWAYMAEAQARTGRPAEARESLRQAEEHDPEHPMLETVRASLLALERPVDTNG